MKETETCLLKNSILSALLGMRNLESDIQGCV